MNTALYFIIYICYRKSVALWCSYCGSTWCFLTYIWPHYNKIVAKLMWLCFRPHNRMLRQCCTSPVLTVCAIGNSTFFPQNTFICCFYSDRRTNSDYLCTEITDWFMCWRWNLLCMRYKLNLLCMRYKLNLLCMRYKLNFLISDFRRDLNIENVLLGISLASICSWPTFRNPVSVPSSKAGGRLWGVRGSKV